MAPKHSPDLAVVGADFSSLLQEERSTKHFMDGNVAAPLERILSVNGVNYSRIRLWVDPEAGTNDLDAALVLGKRSAATGMKILLDLHYSDTWADPQNQKVPAAWTDLNQQELVSTVRNYTTDVVRAFSGQGTPVAMVQIGNEVNKGMLWSWGKIHLSWGEYWEGFAELYKAGAEGVLSATPGSSPRIVVHTYTDHNPSGVLFFEKMLANEMPFDVIGLTYYPFWHGSLDQLERYMNVLSERFDKDIIVVETGYPWTMDDPQGCSNIVGTASNLPERWNYPPTPEGQAAYFDGLRNTLKRIPNGRGLGFFVWEPGWLASSKLPDYMCNEYSALTLFDWNGKPLPALAQLAD